MAKTFGELKPGQRVLEWKYGRSHIRRVVSCADGELELDDGMSHPVGTDETYRVLNRGRRLSPYIRENWVIYADYRFGQRNLQDMALREKHDNDALLERLRDNIRKSLLKKEDIL